MKPVPEHAPPPEAPEPALGPSARQPVRSAADGHEEEIPGLYLARLYEHRHSIAASAVLGLLVAVAFVALRKPTWASEVLVQFVDRSPPLVGIEELSSMFSERNPVDTEIEIIRSRKVLGPVVDKLNLTLEAQPRTFPGIGSTFARRYEGDGVAPPPLGLASYAWGGEQIHIGHLELPAKLVGAPLRLEALAGGEYVLKGPDGAPLLDGEVGKLAIASVSNVSGGLAALAPPRRAMASDVSGAPQAIAPRPGSSASKGVELLVEQLVARPGTQFVVRKRWHDVVMDELRRRLKVAERGRKTGIISISLAGYDPALVCQILDEVAASYIEQNVLQKSAEAVKALEFIEQQLPGLKANMEVAEAALNDFQNKRRTANLSAETQALVARAVEVERSLSELDLQRSDLAERFAPSHPTVKAVLEKRSVLENERAALASKLRRIPADEIDTARLTRDLRVTSELYFTLQKKAQELRVTKSGTIGNVRIVEPAPFPHNPSGTGPVLTSLLGVVLGLIGGFGIAMARLAFDRSVDDPERIESIAGVPIYAAIPHSKVQSRRSSASRDILANTDPYDGAIEALRSLRTNLQFALAEASNNIIGVVGPAPGVGKSFVSVNFAHVLAAADRRVLLVDGDLRRGGLHRVFGLHRSPGLCDVLGREATLSNAVRTTQTRNLDLLLSGTPRPNPSEMLGSPRLEQLLANAAASYDVVLVDTAPVLALTDAMLIARWASINLLVLRAGVHNEREIALAMKYLRQGGAQVRGIIINDAEIGRSKLGRFGHYGYYRYDYQTEL
jgi:tyrosine-protein kinase Etk/Wzc